MSERVPRIRRASLPADVRIVVRGEDLDHDDSAVQAELFRRRVPDWGRWGLSGVTIAFTGELDDGLKRLRTAIHERRPNPYHGKGPDEEVNP